MIDYSGLPHNLQGGMKRYIEDGIPTGDFLRACLSNDLMEAVGQASTKTYEYLYSVMMFLYNEAPARHSDIKLWGSREVVKQWIEHKGSRGLEKTQ